MKSRSTQVNVRVGWESASMMMKPSRGAGMLAGVLVTAAVLTGCNPAAGQNASAADLTAADMCPTADTTGTIRLGLPATLGVFAPALLAETTGAFAAAGLDVEFERVPSSDSLALVAQGQLDGQLTSLSTGHFNVIDTGVDLRWIMPFDHQEPIPAGTPVPGYWSRADVVGPAQDPDLAALAGAIVSTPTGGTGISGLILDNALEGAGLGIDDVTVQQLGGGDALAALENGAVAAAWVSSPFEVEASHDPELVPIAGYAEGVTGTALMAGRGLLDRPELAVRLMQVMSDVTEQYLQGDYRQVPETAELFATATETSVEVARESALLTFDPAFSFDGADAFVQELQQFSLERGSLDYADPLPSEEIIDGRFVEALSVCGRPDQQP
jgi:ABC-type nitrate/sulfonate/bicarbonate transport system substrate-binding protein